MDEHEAFFDFLSKSKQQYFIEVEGKGTNIDKFIVKHNTTYGRAVNRSSKGICVLGSVDKWGIELRIYFYNKTDIPKNWHVQKNNIFRNNQYPYRLDNNKLIEFLFSKGCKLGIN